MLDEEEKRICQASHQGNLFKESSEVDGDEFA
jgi:hypothetical protein